MVWDLCDHKLRSLIIKVEAEFRKLEMKPEETNITSLYMDGCKRLKIQSKVNTSIEASHLPTPLESAKEDPNSPWVIICPKCKEKSYVIYSICKNCKDAEGGKFKTMFKCFKCGNCERSEKFLVQVFNELGIEIPTGMKRDHGIRTVTDEGLR